MTEIIRTVVNGIIEHRNRRGQFHNINGEPAVIYKDGCKIWYNRGDFHNDNGPAITWPDGTAHWYLNGHRHNENGPAVVRANGTKEWYLSGKRYTEAEWKDEMFKRCFL